MLKEERHAPKTRPRTPTTSQKISGKLAWMEPEREEKRTNRTVAETMMITQLNKASHGCQHLLMLSGSAAMAMPPPGIGFSTSAICMCPPLGSVCRGCARWFRSTIMNQGLIKPDIKKAVFLVPSFLIVIFFLLSFSSFFVSVAGRNQTYVDMESSTYVLVCFFFSFWEAQLCFLKREQYVLLQEANSCLSQNIFFLFYCVAKCQNVSAIYLRRLCEQICQQFTCDGWS